MVRVSVSINVSISGSGDELGLPPLLFLGACAASFATALAPCFVSKYTQSAMYITFTLPNDLMPHIHRARIDLSF